MVLIVRFNSSLLKEGEEEQEKEVEQEGEEVQGGRRNLRKLATGRCDDAPFLLPSASFQLICFPSV